MSSPNLRPQDWEHRLHILWAWRKWRNVNTANRDEGATYRAVLDGCAVTLRALCYMVGIKCHFGHAVLSDGPNRLSELISCCKVGSSLVASLPPDNQRCLLEVLYLGNRAVAHSGDGGLDHKVGPQEMTVAINTVLDLLSSRKTQWPELAQVPQEFLDPIK